MDEENRSKTGTRPEPPCGLPKQGNNCANKSTIFCAKCGWNPEEQARRKALPLTKNEAGLLHKDIGK